MLRDVNDRVYVSGPEERNRGVALAQTYGYTASAPRALVSRDIKILYRSEIFHGYCGLNPLGRSPGAARGTDKSLGSACASVTR
ncbi:hypothetical protein EVAR_38531_1 [Eumeta japonica]|uniref:Uncharacterized protein n=1 Tax=Eumeta variegata TaxID=151549 RepID=A0A4C1WB02_EUMVA|nr:hypothetical protein EVAR_38531_1 [Eumeta japonica]